MLTSELFIYNDMDRPEPRLLMSKISSEKMMYVNNEIKSHYDKNSYFEITGNETSLEDFGFISIYSKAEKDTFYHLQYESVAKYPDGKQRKWQGPSVFKLSDVVGG